MKFKDSAIDTDTVPKKGEVEAVGADFGELADASSSKQEALGAADEEADILSKSLGGDFVLEDTLVFDTPQADSKAGDSVGASSGTPSCELTVALVSSDKYDTAALIEKLGKNKNVAAVEPNYYINTNSFDDYSLNDEYSSYLYHVNSPAAKNTGGDSVDNRGIDAKTALSVNASSGWSKLGGDEKEAVVAVVDSGVNYNHEDLKDVMWVNPGNIGLKGTHGYNFAYKNDDPIDDAGHGTHCAGIIAAQANNGKGVAGIASKANIKIMALKTLAGTFGSSTAYANYGAFNYIHKAVQGGVNVVAVNNSWGGTSYSTIYDDLIDMLGADGVVSVVAAGNDGVDNDNNIYHPANSESDYAVTVGAACMNGKAAAFSNYGKASVDVFAPGVNILSTVSHKSFFPSIYSAQLLNATTEYYGEFNADTKVIDGTVTPSTGVRAESMRTGGSARLNSIADAIGIEQAENALNTGANDADAVFMHENNVMLKMRMPGQKHAADSKVVIDVSEGEELNISDDQKNILQAIAQKTGRTIVLTDKLSENVNGTFAPDGRIYINSKIENSNYGVAVALHEAIHGLRTAAPMEYNALKKFIVNYLVEQGENIDDLLDDIAMRWGDSAASEEARLEELVAQTVMALASNERALKTAVECKANRDLLKKALDAIKRIAQGVRTWIEGIKKGDRITGAHNKQAQPWIEDVKALEKLAKMFSKYMDEQRVAVQETTQERNQGGVRYSKKGQSQGIFSNKTVDDYTRIQYNSYGWVAVNNIMTVNELNRFYKQFANTKMLDYNYQKSFDGYYMIPTGDISMVDTKIVFVSGTVQDPYIDRVLTLNNLSDDESNFYVNEVIDCGGQFDSFSYLENLTGKRIFKEYTYADFEDYVSRKNRREKLASTSFTNTDANRRRSYGSQERDGFVNKKSIDDTIKGNDLRFAVDDEITDDLFDTDGDLFEPENKEYLDKFIKTSPDEATLSMYNSLSKTGESVIKEFKGIKLSDENYRKAARRLMKDYDIKLKLNPGTDVELADRIKNFVLWFEKNPNANYNEALNVLADDCKGFLLLSGDYVDSFKEERQDLLSRLKGRTLVLRSYEEDQILENFGGIKGLRRAFFGKANVGYEKNAKGKPKVYIEDLVEEFSEQWGKNWASEDDIDSFAGWAWLDNMLNNVLKPKFVNPYTDGEMSLYRSIDAVAVEMAMQITDELVKEKADAAAKSKSADKKLITELRKKERAAHSAKEALEKSKKEKYKKLADEEKRKRIEMSEHYSDKYKDSERKRIEQNERFRERIREVEGKNKEYRRIIFDSEKSIRERYIEAREKTRYRKLLAKEFERMTKRLDGKAKNNEYIPEKLKKPIKEFLSLFEILPEKGKLPSYWGEYRRISDIGAKIDELASEYEKLGSTGKTETRFCMTRTPRKSSRCTTQSPIPSAIPTVPATPARSHATASIIFIRRRMNTTKAGSSACCPKAAAHMKARLKRI